MNRFSTVTKPLMWFTALLLTAVVAGCGGGNAGTTLVSITVSPANPSIVLGTTQQFTATGTYSDTTTQDLTTSVAWSSSGTGVATVSNAAGSNGLATSVATGNTTITATLAAIGSTAIIAPPGSISGATTLTVTATLVSIAVTPATPSIPVTTTQQFTAIATYNVGPTVDVTASAIWASSDTGVATFVSTAGLATGDATGQSTITATFGGQTSPPATLTVNAATLVSIAVTPATASIPVTTTQQFTAIATYNVGPTVDVTASAIWASSDTGVATFVSTAGQSTGDATGQSTITATFGGQTSPPATLTVNAATLVSIAVTPATASIPVTTTRQFTAIATYDFGPTVDVTAAPGIVWSSGDTNVATVVPASGLATGVAFGTSDITAAFGGQTSPIATLTVTDPGPSGPSPDLGTAGTYGVFASANATVTLVDNSTRSGSLVTGNVGLMDGAGACNGCDTTTVGGVIDNGIGTPAEQAQLDFRAAYADASVRATNACTLSAFTEIAGPQGACAGYAAEPGSDTTFGGVTAATYEPGLYTSGSTLGLGVNKTVFLDAGGNQDAVFIFQAGTAITTLNGSQVILINGAQAKNVWWMAGSDATLGYSSTFRGTIITNGATGITVTGGSTALAPTLVEGRLLSAAAVSVSAFATVTVPQ